jgi:hypothetical protein
MKPALVVARYAFSASCDPDWDGSQFYVGEHPHCPFCGSSRMESWALTDRLVELDVPPVRHSNWSGPEAIERRSCIREAPTELEEYSLIGMHDRALPRRVR